MGLRATELPAAYILDLMAALVVHLAKVVTASSVGPEGDSTVTVRST